MVRPYINDLILHCLFRLKGERTVHSVYHLLSGKKSSQTIQDCRIFHLAVYFSTLPLLERNVFNKAVSELEKDGIIVLQDEKGNYLLHDKSLKILEEFHKGQKRLTHLNGYLYHRSAQMHWRRFALLFQVLSNSVHQNKKYYAVDRDITVQSWVKSWIGRNKHNLTAVTASLHDELQQLLMPPEILDMQAEIFIRKCSGFHRVGYNNNQIKSQLELDETEVHYLFLDTLHFLFRSAFEEADRYPVLSSIFTDERVTLTKSSAETWYYLKQGYSIEEIVRIRRLKKNTIEDHIVEIALQSPNFDVSPFLNNELYAAIQRVITDKGTRQLKLIKQELPADVSFFQIRLAFIKGGWPK